MQSQAQVCRGKIKPASKPAVILWTAQIHGANGNRAQQCVKSVRTIAERNTKHQTPNTKHQAPNTKHQTPNTREAPSSKRGPRFGAWNLGFLWCLELGFWCFDSGISLVFGVWDLVFGVWNLELVAW